MNIRKLIREELDKILDNKEVEKQFDQDIIYLNGFKLNKKENKGNYSIWIFDHKEKNYTIRFYIQKNNQVEQWKSKVFIYWKTPSKEFTNAKGKDFEGSFGPFSSYDEMVKELNRKLDNHPNISKENFLDDNNTQFDKDLIEMVKLMLNKGDKIEAVKNENFNDLKKIFKKVKEIKDIKTLKDFLNKESPSTDEKQTLLLTIQKIYQLDFYLDKEKLDSLF